MADLYIKYPYDPTGKNANNLISGELHTLAPVSEFPYKIITMDNGGFYAKSVRVYDSNYDRLTEEVDYILTYRYAHISQMLGLEVCNDIVFLDPNRTGSVYVSAQIVGSDVAFSLTGITDYVAWYNTQETGYIPRMFDYNGNQPEWLPGELDEERWRLDTYQPFNNEIYDLSRATQGGRGIGENTFRTNVKSKYMDYLARFNDRLQLHIDNEDNPHQDTKTQIGLRLVQNFSLATKLESSEGTLDTRYQTPELSWETVNQFGFTPLENHVLDYSNVHQTTPEKINAPRKIVIDSDAASKYGDNETVINASAFMNGLEPYTYLNYYNHARTDIPAPNFSAGGDNGYLNPNRLGRGTPTSRTVLRSGVNPQWTSIDSLILEYQPKVSAGCLTLSFPAGTSPATAYATAMAQPFAITAALGSIICYSLRVTYAWGTGNGAVNVPISVTYVAYKSPNGWLQV